MKLVKINAKIRKCLECANIENNEEYVNIEEIKKACLINSENWRIPIEYQYIWFTLHHAKTRRKIKNNKYIEPKIGFFPIFVESTPKTYGLLKKAISICKTTRQFSKYINRHETTVSKLVNERKRIQITTIMKICQIFGLDLKEVLMNCKLYAQDSKDEEAILFDEKLWKNLCKVSPIIKCEGHIESFKPHIEIKQEISGIDFLLEVKEMFKNIPQKVEIDTIQNKNRKYARLKFSSSVIRQLLCLFFDLEPGYKCASINLLKDLKYTKTIEDKKYILAKCLETDGGFGRNRKISFSCLSREFVEDIHSIMNELNYNPQLTNSDVNIYTIDGITRCSFDILPYLKHKDKIEIIHKWFDEDKIMLKLRLKSKKINELILEARDYVCNSKFKNYELAKHLSQKLDVNINRKNVNHWLHGCSVPLAIVMELCNLLNKDYFEYVPNYHSIALLSNKIISNDKFDNIRNIKSFNNLA